jgi:adenosylcobinamide kinase/adenosylcobinamide-phosphate guanylyltransferase
MALTLIIGGARSGKSDFASSLVARRGSDVLVVATMDPRDGESRARVAAHRAARPEHWRTIEEPLAPLAALERVAPRGGAAILDCVTVWVSNLLLAASPTPEDMTPAEAQAALASISREVGALARWSAGYDGELIAVTNEVGAGVVPAYALGRYFRDALGSANRQLARRADRVFSVVAGLALELKSAGALPVEAGD